MNMFICINAKYSQKPPPNSHMRATLAFAGFLILGHRITWASQCWLPCHLWARTPAVRVRWGPCQVCHLFLDTDPHVRAAQTWVTCRPSHCFIPLWPTLPTAPWRPLNTGMNNCRDKNKPLHGHLHHAKDPPIHSSKCSRIQRILVFFLGFEKATFWSFWIWKSYLLVILLLINALVLGQLGRMGKWIKPVKLDTLKQLRQQ